MSFDVEHVFFNAGENRNQCEEMIENTRLLFDRWEKAQ